ncbi:hypothetical protein [Paenibacillus sp. FSL K6-2524]|uniref:hypothetical protein n=1 Tax=Paenibacillus sp. FSL K6-2524 TaxID=2954516 RepID=UPI0030FAD830
MRKLFSVLAALILGYLIYFYYFSESLNIGEETAKTIAIGTAYNEFGQHDLYIYPDISLFKTKRKNIEKELPFYLQYKEKYYYRIMLKHQSKNEFEAGDQLSIIYTIDAKNGAILSRFIGNERRYYNE